MKRKLIAFLDYEIYLYDQAGHGFSSHVPRGFEDSDAHKHQDLRTILQSTFGHFSHIVFISFSCIALGWTKEKITIIGHSYGAILGMIVKSR